eukprot:tig00021435_g21384.t1
MARVGLALGWLLGLLLTSLSPPPAAADVYAPPGDLRPILVTAPTEQQLPCTANLVGSIQRASSTARMLVLDRGLSTDAREALRRLDGVQVIDAPGLDLHPAIVVERALEHAVSVVYVDACLEVVDAGALRELYEAVQARGWFWPAVEVPYLQPTTWCSDAIIGVRRGSWGHTGVVRGVAACRANATCWGEMAHAGEEAQRLYTLTLHAVRSGCPARGTRAWRPSPSSCPSSRATPRRRGTRCGCGAGPEPALLRGEQTGADGDLVLACVGPCGPEERQAALAQANGLRCFRELQFFQAASEDGLYDPPELLRQLLASEELAAWYSHLFLFGPELRVVRRNWLDAMRHAVLAAGPFWALASPFDDGVPPGEPDPADGRPGAARYADGHALYSLGEPFRSYLAGAGLLERGGPLFEATFVRDSGPALLLREAALLGRWPAPAAVRAMFRYAPLVRSALYTEEAAAGLGVAAPGAHGAPSLAAWPGPHDDGAYLLSPQAPPAASAALAALVRRAERLREAQWEQSGRDEAAAAAAVAGRQFPAGGCGPQTRALVFALSKFYGGLGAVLQWLVAGLQYAAASNRTLVILEEADSWVWAPPERCGAGRTWSCYFEPVSSCSARDVWPSGVEVPLSDATEGSASEPMGPGAAARGDGGVRAALPQVVPLRPPRPPEFEHRGALWWKAQLAAFAFRPLEAVWRAGDEARAALAWGALPLHRAACLHVRRGDKIRGPLQEAFPISLADYAAAVRGLGGAVSHIFLATDDPGVVGEMAGLLPNHTLLVDRGERRSDGAVLKIWGGDPNPGGTGAAKVDPVYEIATAVKNLQLLSECSYFVGTFSSQFSRFAYFLKVARGSPHALSLDDPILARLP